MFDKLVICVPNTTTLQLNVCRELTPPLLCFCFAGGPCTEGARAGRGGARPEPVPSDVLRDETATRRFHIVRCHGQTQTSKCIVMMHSVYMNGWLDGTGGWGGKQGVQVIAI